MVEFIFRRDGISASGHALFAPHGQDIVCAALSAVFVSGIMCFQKKDLHVTKANETWSMKVKSSALNDVKNLTMLQMMKKQIAIIAKHYPQYVKIIRKY